MKRFLLGSLCLTFLAGADALAQRVNPNTTRPAVKNAGGGNNNGNNNNGGRPASIGGTPRPIAGTTPNTGKPIITGANNYKPIKFPQPAGGPNGGAYYPYNPGYPVYGGYGYPYGAYGYPGLGYGVDPIIGQVQNGVYFPVQGGWAYFGSTQPYVLNAPTMFGGPAFIQQPIFGQAGVWGGVGGGVVGGAGVQGDGFLNRFNGGNVGGVGIGPNGIGGFNNRFFNGIGIGLNGGNNFGNKGGLNWQAGPQGAVPGGLAANAGINNGRNRFGVNVTAVQANAFQRNLFQPIGAVGAPVFMGGGPMMLGGGGQFVGGPGTGLVQPIEGVPATAAMRNLGPGFVAPPSGDTLDAEDVRRLSSKTEVSHWLTDMWQSPGVRNHIGGLGQTRQTQLFGYALEMMRTTLQDGAAVKMPDGSTVQLRRADLLILVGADGRSTTGWLKGQEMPSAFEAVAIHYIQAVAHNK